MFLVAAVVPLAAFVQTLAQASAVLGSDGVTESYAWIPELAIALIVRLDVLSWVLALVVTGVGSLVLVYCAKYFDDHEVALGRFAGILLAFAGAMYRLVIADDVYLLCRSRCPWSSSVAASCCSRSCPTCRRPILSRSRISP